MPWHPIKLKDDTIIPSIAFGTSWKTGKEQDPSKRISVALSCGFKHIDTAQGYDNETAVKEALSHCRREDVFITTKYSNTEKTISATLDESLKKVSLLLPRSLSWLPDAQLDVEYVDLYLIHSPKQAPDIPAAWEEMVALKKKGKAKSIGVSNFDVAHLEILLAHTKRHSQEEPAVNQIRLHPYVWAAQESLVKYHAEHKIVTEAFRCLEPITKYSGGVLDIPLDLIAHHHRVSPDAVLLAWARSKGAVVITSSSNEERLKGYLKAGDLELSEVEIRALERAGQYGVPVASQ